MKGRRVLVIDDVITAGKALRTKQSSDTMAQWNTSSSKLISHHPYCWRSFSFLWALKYHSILVFSSTSVLYTHFILPHTTLFLSHSPFYLCAGTAIRESVDILNAAGAILVAVAVSLDRQEKATDTATESAIQVRRRRGRRRKRSRREGKEWVSACKMYWWLTKGLLPCVMT